MTIVVRKGHIRHLCHVKNVKVRNGLMEWVPKDFVTNPQGHAISWGPKLTF